MGPRLEYLLRFAVPRNTFAVHACLSGLSGYDARIRRTRDAVGHLATLSRELVCTLEATMAEQEQKKLKIDSIEVERLLLDDENPRLSGISDKRTQDDLVRVLWDEMAVSEVALSIAENGYFEEEPL